MSLCTSHMPARPETAYTGSWLSVPAQEIQALVHEGSNISAVAGREPTTILQKPSSPIHAGPKDRGSPACWCRPVCPRNWVPIKLHPTPAEQSVRGVCWEGQVLQLDAIQEGPPGVRDEPASHRGENGGGLLTRPR